ncbi:peptidase S8/S53 domain-containing protein [Gigaspora rosea]|uniref:Peptidase S8/S53 domain-containing protein n=1 Tax=Gigaspora rosea TaxID=44941 RepID=A0A397UWS3_9GLOM|nr:peptidase S8/S53 domain-containing protein [Gigaspora rosea]
MFSKRILNILFIFNLTSFIISAPLTICDGCDHLSPRSPSPQIPSPSDDAACPNIGGTNEQFIDYNVMLKTNATNYDSVVKNHFEMLEKCLQKERYNVHELDFSSIKDNNVIFDFSVKGMIAGYTTKFTKSFVENYLSKLNDVAIVNENKVIEDPFENEFIKQAPLVRKAERPVAKMPNLDRIDQENYPLNLTYIYPDSAGAGVDVFVVDSGIFLEHEEFQGRQGKTVTEKTFCGDSLVDDDGHGTNVASIVGGKTLGVASNANIIGVKITGKDCPVNAQNIINGITYVMQQKANNPERKIVLNLSATSRDSAVGEVASKAVEAGIHFVVGAGNRNLDACGFFPGKIETVVTVASTKITPLPNQLDWASDFTNWEKCVTLFAPGEKVPVAGIKSASEITSESGTSLSAPHVSGAIALMLADGDYTPEQSKEGLLRIATKDKIQGLDFRPTANLLLRTRNAVI